MKPFICLSFLALCLMAFSAPTWAAEAAKTEELPKGGEQPESINNPNEPQAEDTKAEDNPGYFSPPPCDFEITFPEKPYLAQKCMPDGKTCYNLYSYTMVYDLHTTVDVSVTCNKSTPAEFKRYNEAVMKAALTGMIAERNLSNHSISYREDKETRSASLSGTGVTGAQEKIYTSQIWVGQHSVFTVQAELIGGEHKDADKTFSDILKSVKLKEKPGTKPKVQSKE